LGINLGDKIVDYTENILESHQEIVDIVSVERKC